MLSPWLVLIGAFILLRANLWRAVLMLYPRSARVEVDEPGPVVGVPPELEAMHESLRQLGFSSIGSHLEHPRLGYAVLWYDYASADHKVFASICRKGRWGFAWSSGLAWVTRADSDGPTARLTLTTAMENGALLVSSNYRRPGANLPGRYLCGAIEAVPAERLLRAHVRRFAELGTPASTFTIEARALVARRWFNDVGKTELRQQHAAGLLWTLGAIGMVGAFIFSQAGFSL